jgi:hypothetical protein
MIIVKKLAVPFSAGMLFAAASFAFLHAEGIKTHIMGDGKPNRVNIVYLAEGYTQAQQAKFVSDVKMINDGYFKFQPWNRYRSYCNVDAISVVSKDSGVGHWDWAPNRETYFGFYYDTNRTEIRHKARIFERLSEHASRYTVACVLINEVTTEGTGGKDFVSFSLTPTEQWCIVLHEIAHNFAGLSDEYSYMGYSGLEGDEEKNATKKTVRSQIRWNSWIAASTPVPTHPGDVPDGEPGLFEGANYRETGWYRPQLNCMMNGMYSPFCKICREEIIVAIHTKAPSIDTSFPSTAAIIENKPGEKLVIKPLHPDSMHLKTELIVNGIITAITNDTLSLSLAGLKEGINTVTARVVDTTGMVRIPSNLPFLVDSLTWRVNGRPTSAVEASVAQSTGRLQISPLACGVRLNYYFSRPQPFSVALCDMRGALRYARRGIAPHAGWNTVTLSENRLNPGAYAVEFVSGNFVIRRLVEFVR